MLTKLISSLIIQRINHTDSGFKTEPMLLNGLKNHAKLTLFLHTTK